MAVFVRLAESRYATRVSSMGATRGQGSWARDRGGWLSRLTSGGTWLAAATLGSAAMLSASGALWPSAAAASEPDAEAQAEHEESHGPDDGVARPEAEDLRTGHVLIGVSGGVWVPSKPLFPEFAELGDPNAGGTAHLSLGIGLAHDLVFQLEGGFAMAPSAVASCSGCRATSIDAGGAFVFQIAQGFALDPWVSFGMGYRHNLLSLDTEDAPATSAFDFAKFALGANYFPTPTFGFGPYAATDVGVRKFDDATFYAAFHIGMKVTFDPLRAGASAAPVATASASTPMDSPMDSL